MCDLISIWVDRQTIFQELLIMRIDRLLLVGAVAVCIMTGCKAKKADNPKPAAMQAHPVSMQNT